MKRHLDCWLEYLLVGLSLFTAAGRGLVGYDGWDKNLEGEVIGHD